MNTLRCSDCSFLNFATATACKRCGAPFDSADGTASDFYPSAPGDPNAQATEGGSYFWDQPAYQPSSQQTYRPNYVPPPVQRGSGGGRVVKGVIILAVLALVSFLAIPKLLKSGKTNFANVTWREYRSPDNKFSISLPAGPKESVVSQPSPLGNLQVHVLESQVSKEGGCMMMYTDFPMGDIRMSEDTIYEGMIRKMAGESNGLQTGARKYITHDGRKGIEIELKSTPESKFEIIGVARLFWVSPRIYVLMTFGPDTPDFRAFQPKCNDSFKIFR